MQEIWKSIPNYEGYYEVSNTGKIRSLTRTIIDKNGIVLIKPGQELTLTINKITGYKYTNLSKDGKAKTYYVHRLVALTFLPNPNNLPVINHKDENKLNNNVNNLEWCTQKYNCNYGTRNQRIHSTQRSGRKIWKCDYNTHEKLELFISAAEAAASLGKDRYNAGSLILKCAKGEKKSAYGYYWIYDE